MPSVQHRRLRLVMVAMRLVHTGGIAELSVATPGGEALCYKRLRVRCSLPQLIWIGAFLIQRSML